MIKPIETEYRGQLFRSRLEARWAVFFDACGVEWEYESQGFDLGDGLWYLPDFVLHGVGGDAPSDTYVEVKGEYRGDDDKKIINFSMERPLLVLRDIPRGSSWIAILHDIRRKSVKTGTYEFNAMMLSEELIFDTAVPVIGRDGKFKIVFDDRRSRNIKDVDEKKTERAYALARNIRF